MGAKKQYIKKIVVKDQLSAPDSRGKRLRKIRNLSNFTREQLAKYCNISSHTLKRWELGYFGGLPLDGAKTIIDLVAKEGVVCSLDWLLYEIGPGPQVISDFKKTTETQVNNGSSFTSEDDEKNITEELILFRSLYPNVIVCQINDDGLFPYYDVGDYVAGIECRNEMIKKLINKNCIIRLSDGKIITRNLRQGSVDDLYTLTCTNINTTVNTPILHNVSIASAAFIQRHYVKSKL